MTWSNMVDSLWPKIMSMGDVLLMGAGKIILALLVLLAGLYLSRLIGTYTSKLLNKIKLDEKTQKIGMNELMAKVGLGKSPSYIISFVLSWMVVLIAVFYITKIFGMKDIEILLQKLLVLIPNLCVAILIVFAGLLLGKFTANIIGNSSKENNIQSGVIIAQIANTIIIVFASLVALEYVGMNTMMINMFMTIVLASLGLAFALAFGLGAKNIVEELLRASMNKDKKENK